MRLLGPQASEDSRQSTCARLSLMAGQLFAGRASISEDFALPPEATAELIAAWFTRTSVKWPMALNSPMPDLTRHSSISFAWSGMMQLKRRPRHFPSRKFSAGCWLSAHSSGLGVCWGLACDGRAQCLQAHARSARHLTVSSDRRPASARPRRGASAWHGR